MKTVAAAIAMAVILSGCGSVTTTAMSDRYVAASLKRSNTRCDSVPRLYSGVAYDFCKLHSDPSSGYYNWFLGFYFVDVLPSAVADTVLLPYSIYAQTAHGNVELY